MNLFFASGDQSIEASASASVLPMSNAGLISFKNWIDLLAVQKTLKSLLQHHNSKSSILSALSLHYGQTITSIHDYWKNHSFDYTELCWKSDVSAF